LGAWGFLRLLRDADRGSLRKIYPRARITSLRHRSAGAPAAVRRGRREDPGHNQALTSTLSATPTCIPRVGSEIPAAVPSTKRAELSAAAMLSPPIARSIVAVAAAAALPAPHAVRRRVARQPAAAARPTSGPYPTSPKARRRFHTARVKGSTSGHGARLLDHRAIRVMQS